MPINSKQKGKRGELEFCHALNKLIPLANARRGQQFKGTPDSPDVLCDLPFHFEVKRVNSLNLHKAMEQALQDCGCLIPIVASRKDQQKDWYLTLSLTDFATIVRRMNDKLRQDFSESVKQ